jgi:hypothetical protein
MSGGLDGNVKMLKATPDDPVIVEIDGRKFNCWTDNGSGELWWLVEVDGEDHELAPASPTHDEAILRTLVKIWWSEVETLAA